MSIALLTRILWLVQFLLALWIGLWLSERWLLSNAMTLLCSASIVLVLPLLIHGFILLVSFTLSRQVARPIPPGLASGPIPLAKAFFGELRDSALTFSMRMPFQVGWSEEQPAGHEQKPAVILIHGFVCNRGMWAPLAGSLNQKGYFVHAISLQPVWGSIDDYLPAMHAAYRQALKEHQQVVFIGHSMGGLVIRNFLRSCTSEQRTRIARVITLGTPHLGTVHARLGFGDNAAQMRPDSTWLEVLAADEARRGGLGVPTSIVLSHHDNIVAPQAPQKPAVVVGSDVLELSGLGHLTLAYHPRVWQHISQLLGVPANLEVDTAH